MSRTPTDDGRADHYPLGRRAVVAALLADAGDLLVVTGLGAPAWDATAAGDRDLTFPLWGAMGGAVSMGLGLALARPEDRVLVLTGDGELLMGLGSLSTVGHQQPANLAVVVLDNERYGETGMQKSHTAHGADLAAIAQGCGFPIAATITDEADLDRIVGEIRSGAGPMLVVIKITAGEAPRVLPSRDGVDVKNRFRRSLGL